MVKTVKKRGYNRRSKRMNRSRLSRNKRPQTTRKKRNKGKSNLKSNRKQTTRRKRNDIKYSLRKQTKRKKSKRKISTGVGSAWVGGGAKGGAKGRVKSSETGARKFDALLKLGKFRREREKNKKANTEVGWLAAPGATVDIEYADSQDGPTTPLNFTPPPITATFRTTRELQEGDKTRELQEGDKTRKLREGDKTDNSPVEATSSREAPRVSSSKNRYTAAIVPPGKQAGDMIQIQRPGGDMFQVKIPDGFTVGQAFPIEIPESPTDQTSDISDATEAIEATAVPATTAIAPIGNLLENINLNDYQNILDNVQSKNFKEEDKVKLEALAKMLQGQSVEDQSDSKMQKLQGYIIKLYGLLGSKLERLAIPTREKVKGLIEKLVAKVTKQSEDQKGGGVKDDTVSDNLLNEVEEMIKYIDTINNMEDGEGEVEKYVNGINKILEEEDSDESGETEVKEKYTPIPPPPPPPSQPATGSARAPTEEELQEGISNLRTPKPTGEGEQGKPAAPGPQGRVTQTEAALQNALKVRRAAVGPECNNNTDKTACEKASGCVWDEDYGPELAVCRKDSD